MWVTCVIASCQSGIASARPAEHPFSDRTTHQADDITWQAVAFQRKAGHPFPSLTVLVYLFSVCFERDCFSCGRVCRLRMVGFGRDVVVGKDHELWGRSDAAAVLCPREGRSRSGGGEK